MKRINGVFCLLLCTMIWSCYITGNAHKTGQPAPQSGTIENPNNALTLVDHLRKITGVMVRGNGENATITIRGGNSISSSTEPLFVLNGQPLAGGLKFAMQAVPVTEIKSIRVLRNPAETGIYGARGANGVIEIKTNNGSVPRRKH